MFGYCPRLCATRRRKGIECPSWLGVIVALWLVSGCVTAVWGQQSVEPRRCVVLEFYLRQNDPLGSQIAERARAYVDARENVSLRVLNMDQDARVADRFRQIQNYFRLPQAMPPALYGCKYLLYDIQDLDLLPHELDAMLTVNIFVRPGCNHCDAAKAFLSRIESRYPCFKFVRFDVTSDANAVKYLQQMTDKYQVKAVSYPVIQFCNEISVGWISDEIQGRKIESTLNTWTVPCPPPRPRPTGAGTETSGNSHPRRGVSLWNGGDVRGISPLLAGWGIPLATGLAQAEYIDSPLDDLPAIPVAPAGDETPLDDLGNLPVLSGEQPNGMEVPVLGRLSVSALGMPAFTFLVGLVDGFNPCAMWVLLFLLSVLVNLKSRVKILAVAGTFVVISGLAYLAFMAAWLNVFLLVGYLRTVQIALAVLALGIGTIHIKDFFAFKQGVSLSIPESAKPGIYARVRRIVTAENLTAAICGAAVLAVLVNLVELLCTAGLPALYSQILTQQGFPAWKNYTFLLLYILAYMLDDALMVGIVVVTLDRRKMQEQHGRWLKLLSGSAIALLGLVMLFRPDWLS